MDHYTFREHLMLMEARSSDRVYTEKKVKNIVDRVTVALAGNEASVMTKLAKRYARLEVSLKAIQDKHKEMNADLKQRVGDLFDAEDAVLTRVAETAQFTLTLNKEIKKEDTSSVDYEAIAKALTALIDDSLQPAVEKIYAQFTKVVPAKEPVKSLKVSKEVVKEGIIEKITSFVKSILNWATGYDKKLAKLKAQAGME